MRVSAAGLGTFVQYACACADDERYAPSPHPAPIARPEGRASFRTPYGATFSPREKGCAYPPIRARRERCFARWRRDRRRRGPCGRLVLYPTAPDVPHRDGCAGSHLRARRRRRADGPGLSLLVRQLQPDPPGFAPFRRPRQLSCAVARSDRAPCGDQHFRLHLRRRHARIRSRPWRCAAPMARRLVQPHRARPPAYSRDRHAAGGRARLQGAAQSGIRHARLSPGRTGPQRSARAACRPSARARARSSPSTPGNGRR